MKDPIVELATALTDANEKVRSIVDGLGVAEQERAIEFVVSAYDLAVEMWFQKGDPAAPRLTNWERPWRKYGRESDHDLPECTSLTRSSIPIERQHRRRGLRRRAGVHQGSGLQRPLGEHL